MHRHTLRVRQECCAALLAAPAPDMRHSDLVAWPASASDGVRANCANGRDMLLAAEDNQQSSTSAGRGVRREHKCSAIDIGHSSMGVR